jgi:hypothetical protein
MKFRGVGEEITDELVTQVMNIIGLRGDEPERGIIRKMIESGLDVRDIRKHFQVAGGL